MKKQLLISAAALFALGSGIATLQANSAFAQANAPAATQNEPQHRDFAAHLERRITHLKSELKITPAQESLFNTWAQAMRDNATEMQQTFTDLRGTRGQAHTAVDRLETNVKLTELRVTEDQRYLDAFKPLYASLSADQQKTADHLMAPHRGHHWF